MAHTPEATRTPPHPIAYLTDVEGRWEKLAGFCEDNPHVQLDAQGHLRVRPGATLVFGGDAVDRGPDGLRVLRTLLEARRRQPSQVVLLAGNRDINKLRLARELRGHPPSRTPEALKAGPRPALLRWIFENTMGARGAFEFRQAELSRTGPVGEEDVVDSFLEDVGPGGLLRDYLGECQLVYRQGVTLFVHGGVHEDSLGTVPGRGPVPEVDAWAEALNAWYRAQLEAFAEGRLGAGGTPGWEALIQYQAPSPGQRVNTASVVYGRMADGHNHPVLPSRAVIERLEGAGMYRVVVGHTPSGDCPSVLREGGFELVLADNSYGRVEGASQVFVGDDSLYVRGRVKLDDGRLEEVRFGLERGDDSVPTGRQVVDSGHLVKGPLGGGQWLLFKALPRYRVEQRAESERALESRALGAPRADADADAGARG